MKALGTDISDIFQSLPDSLATEGCRRRILEISKGIPSAAVSRYGFEIWLGKNHGRADFLYKIGPSIEHAVFWAQNTDFGFDVNSEGKFSAPEICKAWVSDRFGWQNFINDLWLEHDVEPDRPINKIPDGTFIGLKQGIFQNEFGIVSEQILPALLGMPLPLAVRHNLEFFIQLPSQAHIFHVGTLQTRPQKFLRICITDVDFQFWIDFLPTLFPQNAQNLVEDLKLLQSLTNFLVLDLDIWESISPRFGIECYIWDRMPVHAKKWPILFQALIQMGWMAAQQKDALLQWAGMTISRSETMAYEVQQKRRLHHLKMTWDAGFQGAKIYLSVDKMTVIGSSE